jgi:hypothetical protein
VSIAGLGLRDELDHESLDHESLDHESEVLPRTHTRRAAAEAQARERTLAHEHGPKSARARAPIAAYGYDSGRTRIDANGVRTVKIRGQATPPRRRPLVDFSRPIGRYDQHPDRAAQWALFLGVFMVVVAIVTGS